MALVVNKHGQDWLILKKWADDKIAEHQEALIQSSEDGDIRRGAIRVLREMVAMVEPEALPETVEHEYP